MAPIIGFAGSCTAGGTAVGIAKAWSLDINGETVDTTDFSSNGWKESVSTLKSWSGSITVNFDGGADTGVAAIIAGLTGGSSVALVLLTGATGSGSAETFTGSANITSMPMTQDVNGIVEVSFSFEGTGALTLAGVA